MHRKFCWLAVVSLLPILGADAIAAETGAWTIHGQVVDNDGRAVADADVCDFWTANGIPRDDDGRPWTSDEARSQAQANSDAGMKKLYGNIGAMEPCLALPRARSDADGRFAVELPDDDSPLIAMDRQRRRGAVALVERSSGDLKTPLVLRDLVRVRGRMVCAEPRELPKWGNVYVGVTPDARHRPLDYFRLMECGTLDGAFAVSLPPGTYELEIYSTEPEAKVKNGLPLVVSAERADVDLGDIELRRGAFLAPSRVLEWQAKGGRGDYKQHFGRRPPEWHIADARGVGRDVQLADYHGRWVVLEFWNLSCVTCLKRDLPAWSEFYEAHRKQRDRFEILAICVDVGEDLETIGQVEKGLAPIVEHVWKGHDLPFPILLDSKLRTWQSFGLEYMAATLLIDPDGNLVEAVGSDAVRQCLTKHLDELTEKAR